MRTVLVISPTALAPWPGGGGSRTATACRYLPDCGWRTSLLAADFGPQVPEWTRSIHCIRAPWPRLWRRGTHSAAWKSPRRGPRPSAMRRFLWALGERALGTVLFPDESVTWAPSAVRTALREFSAAPPDAVLSMAPRFSAHIVGERLARLWGAPWVAEFQDPFVGNIFVRWPSPIHRAAAVLLERRWVRRAAAVTTTSECFRQQLAARYPTMAAKMHVVHNGYDTLEPEPVALDSDHFHVVHCGQFYAGRVPDYFLKAIAGLCLRRPDLAHRLRVHFVGPVSERVEALSRQLGLTECVRSEGVAPHALSIGWMQAADLLLLIKHVSPLAVSQVPTKLYEYLAAGKPILALAHQSEMARILRRAGGGVIVPPTDVEAIGRAVETSADGRGLDGLIPDSSYVKQFALPTLMSRMARVLDFACGSERSA